MRFLWKNLVYARVLKQELSDATPTFRKARPLPYAMKKKVENELNRLEQKGIITKVCSSCCSSSEA